MLRGVNGLEVLDPSDVPEVAVCLEKCVTVKEILAVQNKVVRDPVLECCGVLDRVN